MREIKFKNDALNQIYDNGEPIDIGSFKIIFQGPNDVMYCDLSVDYNGNFCIDDDELFPRKESLRRFMDCKKFLKDFFSDYGTVQKIIFIPNIIVRNTPNANQLQTRLMAIFTEHRHDMYETILRFIDRNNLNYQ